MDTATPMSQVFASIPLPFLLPPLHVPAPDRSKCGNRTPLPRAHSTGGIYLCLISFWRAIKHAPPSRWQEGPYLFVPHLLPVLFIPLVCRPPSPRFPFAVQRQPQPFNDITIRVGDAIEVADLLAQHEDKHGPLWKYSAAVTEGGADDEVRVYK